MPLAVREAMASLLNRKTLSSRARDISVPGSDTIVYGGIAIFLIFVGKELCYRDAIEELNMSNITQKL